MRIAFKRHRGISAGTQIDFLPRQVIGAVTQLAEHFAAINRIQDDLLRRIMDGLGLSPDDFDWIRPKTTSDPTT